jgi:XTP/dITP diphosphohydrolase
VIVLVRWPEDPQPIIAEGSMYGEIIDTPRGAGGFGYDPYFLIPELGLTGAEIPMAQKNRISHRGKALMELVDKLKNSAGF